VPGTSEASDHACSVQRVGPGQTWIATSRRGWVIAAWVLACRARLPTRRSGLRATVCPTVTLEAHSVSTTRGYLAVLFTPIRTQWKGPPAGRNLTPSSVNRSTVACQPVALDQDQIWVPELSRLHTICTSPRGRPQVGTRSKRHPQISLCAAQTDPKSTHCRYGPASARPDHGGGGNRRSRAT
jgi:hypothetical protein